MPNAFKKFKHGLISHWQDASYTKKKFNRIFASLSEAIDFYNEETLIQENKMNVQARASMLEPSTARVMSSINGTGASSLCVTLREGHFETFDQEAEVYGLHVNIQKKIPYFENNVTYPIIVNKNSEIKRIGEKRAKKLEKFGIGVTYRNGVIYTGWRRLKGLSMKIFFQDNEIIPHYHNSDKKLWSKKDLVFIDNEPKNFKEIENTLKLYFRNIYFFHLTNVASENSQKLR